MISPIILGAVAGSKREAHQLHALRAETTGFMVDESMVGEVVDKEMASANGDRGVVSWLRSSLSMVRIVRGAVAIVRWEFNLTRGTLILSSHRRLDVECQDAKLLPTAKVSSTRYQREFVMLLSETYCD